MCRRRSIVVWRSKLKRAAGVATWRQGDLEGRSRRVDIGAATWRHRGKEIWRRDAGVATWRRKGMELWKQLIAMLHGARKTGKK